MPQPVLDDLHDRLARTRFLDDSPRRPASGMTSAYLRDLVASWQTFDWRAREAWLNEHPQFLADVDGTTLHVVHQRSATPDAPALLVMHGWPHTFALQLDFADLLPDFDVVVVSLPGFAFSPPLDEPTTEQRLAELVHTLMTDVLGYSRYLTYGEDVTANVSDLVAATYPEAVAGIVVTHAHFLPQDEREATTDPTERAFYDRMAAGWYDQAAYAHAQGTRPDTLAAALNDSPAGLLAWITEKLVEWSDTPAGDPAAVERRISRDADPHRGHPVLGDAEHRDVVPDVLRRSAMPSSRRSRCRRPSSSSGTSTTTPSRWRGASTATCGCSSGWPRAATSPSPRYRRRWRSGCGSSSAVGSGHPRS